MNDMVILIFTTKKIDYYKKWIYKYNSYINENYIFN